MHMQQRQEAHSGANLLSPKANEPGAAKAVGWTKLSSRRVWYMLCTCYNANLCRLHISIFEFCVDLQFHFLVFEFRLIFSWSTKLTLGCARSHWHQSPASCSMLLVAAISSAHVIPCPSHRVVFLNIFKLFFREFWLKLWLNFRRSSSHSSAAKGRQEKRTWVWHLELYLSQTLCLYVQEIFQSLSFCTMERFHHENGEQRFKNTSTGIAVDCRYLAQSWIFASGMAFDKDATKKTAGLSKFIIRLLRDVWPVWHYQSVALKSETCWPRRCNA